MTSWPWFLPFPVAHAINWLAHPPVIKVRHLLVGRHVTIEPGVAVRCDRLVLGDGVTIRSGTRIKMPDLVVGDYTVIQPHCFLTGTAWCRIGHNCWFGDYTVIDSKGTTRIGHGVGVGAHSQLWTHAYFGDIVAGCRFASQQPLVIEDDVWFVGHCIVHPIHAHRQSLALAGSVVTSDMKENRVHLGVPARDVTGTVGPQFVPRGLDEQRSLMQGHLDEFVRRVRPRRNRLRIVDRLDLTQREVTQFSLTERLYLKHLYPEEVAFMRYLLPTKAKFCPHPDTDWVGPHLASTPATPAPDGA